MKNILVLVCICYYLEFHARYAENHVFVRFRAREASFSGFFCIHSNATLSQILHSKFISIQDFLDNRTSVNFEIFSKFSCICRLLRRKAVIFQFLWVEGVKNVIGLYMEAIFFIKDRNVFAIHLIIIGINCKLISTVWFLKLGFNLVHPREMLHGAR